VSIGIPKDSAIKYEAALKTDKFLLIVHGSSDAVYGARFILDGSGSGSYCVHGQPMLTIDIVLHSGFGGHAGSEPVRPI